MAPWQVPACTFDIGDGYELLQSLPVEADLPHDVRLGDDCRFWQIVIHLVLETIAQQKVLPALVAAEAARGAKNVTMVARWAPVLDGPRDGPRLAALRAAMPPLCRAEAETATTPTPHHLLTSFLHEMTDALTRRWGQKTDFLGGQGPAHDWLRALFRDDVQVRGGAAQLRRLESSYRAWLRNLYAAGDQHFRVAFRLEAPAQRETSASGDNTARWMLHFLLRSRADPSLLIPADRVWQARSRLVSTVSDALHAQTTNPQEMLLTGLGYTARLFTPLRRGLEQKHPASAPLSNQEAYTFLRDAAPILEESGFGVLVPPWWNQPGMRLGARLRMKGKGAGSADGVSTGTLTMENLVSYRWEIALGGESLSREEFAALVALKTPLVQVRGQWVQLDPSQIEAAIRFWEKSDRQGDVGLLDAVQMGLGTEQIDGLPVEGVELDGWLQEWMERFTRQEKLALQPEPARLHAQLRPYQQYGYAWLDFQRRWQIGACLADDMGLGKTIQTLTMLLHIKEEAGSLPGPVLLICPTSVVLNWAQEVERFTPDLVILVHQGSSRLQGEALIEQAQHTDIVATSYALARRDGETLRQIDWFGVVLDEAQNIKNAETKQARIIRQLPANFRLALTGTPVENRLTELWSIMHFLNPGFLGSRQKFRQHFAIPIERYGDEKAIRHLRELTAPFILRRVKTDPTVIRDLPDKQETKVYCTLTREQATLYEAVVQDALHAIESAEEMQRKGLVLAMLMKLKQICNHPAQFMHQIGDGYTPNGDEQRSGKLARIVELLEEPLAVGDRALIFTQFAEMGHLLRGFLQHRLGVSTIFLHGGTPARQRAALVERFQEESDGSIPLYTLLKSRRHGSQSDPGRSCLSF